MRTHALALMLPGLFLAGSASAADPPGPPALKVVGTQIQALDGKAVRLYGVNVPSLEWSQGEHVFESLRVAIDDWGANVLRLPLSQDRWFGRTRERKDEGAQYRKTVRDFVDRASAKQCYVILDLHWYGEAAWGPRNGKQHKMPDDGCVEFWTAVAADYANHPAVLLNLYNEPHDISWDTWRDGGTVTEPDLAKPGGTLEYHTPGLQKLLDVCRARGAENVIVVGGLDWGYDLSGVARGHALTDPNGRGVVYDSHIYPTKKDWDRHIAPAAAKYAVMIGEIGTGPADWLPKALEFADAHQLSWIGWCLHPGARPCLIKDWTYAPTPFGDVVKKALREESARR